MPRPLIPEEDLLDELRRLADTHGRAPSTRDMRDRGRYSPTTYEQRFGSWLDALVAAGYETRGRDRSPVERDDLITDLRRVAGEFGRAPTTGEYTERGEYSSPVFYKFWDGWDDALAEAEVATAAGRP